MKYSLWGFFRLLLTYSFISIVAFVLTSSGWTAFLVFLPGSIAFYIFILLAAFVVSLFLRARNVKEIMISKKGILPLLFLQFVTLLFNYGDCGDADGAGPFILRMIIPFRKFCDQPSFATQHAFKEISLYTTFGLVSMIAIGSLVTLAIIYYRPAKQNSATTSLNMLYLSIGLAFIVIASGIYFYLPSIL